MGKSDVDIKTFWEMCDKHSFAEFKPAVVCRGAEISDWCYTEGPSHGQKNLSKT